MTSRLYYDDSYLRQFRARVTARDGKRIYLDRTAFYPASGGQPADGGTIAGMRVIDVADEGDRVAHLVEEPPAAEEVDCAIDWARRFDHMQQHSGQHLISGVFLGEFGIETVSFHLGAEISTIDLAVEKLEAATAERAERRANEVIWENRPVAVSYHERGEEAGLRKQVERSGRIRVVTIEGTDRSACGGTHVERTGEIGVVLLRRIEKVRGKARVEFVCGGRARGAARRDYEGLSQVALLLSCGAGEAAAAAEAQAAKLAESERQRKKLVLELAEMRGRERHRAAAPGPGGLRLHISRIGRGGIGEDVRAEAQAFTACGGAVYIAAAAESGAFLVAVSADAGLHAGRMLGEIVGKLGGRGGGGETMAQGSVADVETAAQAAAERIGSVG